LPDGRIPVAERVREILHVEAEADEIRPVIADLDVLLVRCERGQVRMVERVPRRLVAAAALIAAGLVATAVQLRIRN